MMFYSWQTNREGSFDISPAPSVEGGHDSRVAYSKLAHCRNLRDVLMTPWPAGASTPKNTIPFMAVLSWDFDEP